MKISIIGLGYVGYPLAMLALSKGLDVEGVDKNPEVLERIASESYVTDDPLTSGLSHDDELRCTSTVRQSDVFIVCVPTPIMDVILPDLKYVVQSAHEIAGVLRENDTVIIESTVYPGVCREVVKPILDSCGVRYYLAHCPERINPGDKTWSVRNIPRVVAGVDAASTEKAYEVYRQIIDSDIEKLSQIEAAEATKILENTFRDINIAFVNEMAMSFHKLGIDISEVIRGAATKPFGFMPHYPGVGVGGHCIAIDPYYMIEKGRSIGFDHDFLSLARRINSGMPKFTFDVIQEVLNQEGFPVMGTAVAVLGISYKPNIADDRESPAYSLIGLLESWGAEVTVYDPYHPQKSTAGNLNDALAGSTCAVIVTAHDEFLSDMAAYRDVRIVVDGRNCLDRDRLKEFGIVYRGIGICD